ncbi:MAG: hypothetical protein ACR5LA_11475, partial [Wolbachia sp.]
LHFYSWVTSLLFDNMFPEFTLFSSLFYRFLIRNWGFSRQVLRKIYKGRLSCFFHILSTFLFFSSSNAL